MHRYSAPAAFAFAALMNGCYDSCDREGEVRCRGNTVEVCGYFPGEQMSWDEAVECGSGSVCSAADPDPIPDAHCVLPDITCEAGPGTECVGDQLVMCDRPGAAPRWPMTCEHGCEPDVGRAFCRPSPAPDGG